MNQTPLAEDIQDYAQNIVDTVREPLLILDTTLRVRSANRAFYQTFHVSPGETEGHLIYELGNGQWDIPDLRTLLEDIVPKSSLFDDFELDHTFPAIGRRMMRLNARKLQAGHHGELLVLAMEDVTGRRRVEEEVAKGEEPAEAADRAKSAFLADTGDSPRTTQRVAYAGVPQLGRSGPGSETPTMTRRWREAGDEGPLAGRSRHSTTRWGLIGRRPCAVG